MGNLKPIDSALVKDNDYDLISPDTVGGEYIETIGAACENPDGYTSGSLFLGRENGVQHLYRATAAIAFGETIILDTNCVYTTVSGELEGKAEESEVTSLNEALTNIDSVISANGAKNLLPNTGTDIVNNSISYHVNTDGSVSTSGTVESGYSYFYINYHSLSLKAGTYHLSGSPSGFGTGTYIFIYSNGAEIARDYGSGADFTLSSNSTEMDVIIRVNSGTNVTGQTFKPMITLASQPNSDYAHYVPYAMTNRELTDEVGTSDISALGDGTIKDALVATNAAVIFNSTTTTFEEFVAAVTPLLEAIKAGQYIPNIGTSVIKAVPLCGRKVIHFGTTYVEYGSGILIQNADRVTGYVMSYDLSHFVVFRFRSHYGDQSSYNIIF